MPTTSRTHVQYTAASCITQETVPTVRGSSSIEARGTLLEGVCRAANIHGQALLCSTLSPRGKDLTVIAWNEGAHFLGRCLIEEELPWNDRLGQVVLVEVHDHKVPANLMSKGSKLHGIAVLEAAG